MLNEERDLLIKEVCARIPYNVKCKFEDKIYDILGFAHGRVMLCLPFMSNTITTPIENIELYLLPLSSMSEEQKEELFFNYIHNDIYFDDFTDYFLAGELWHDICVSMTALPALFDWLNKNNFDYQGLIAKGIVKDATNLNIY